MFKKVSCLSAGSVPQGERWVWLSGGVVSFTLLMAFLLMGLLLVNGLRFLWPQDVLELRLKSGLVVWGQLREKVPPNKEQPANWKLKTGNRELSNEFQWVSFEKVASYSKPRGLLVLEREEFGDFYGRFHALLHDPSIKSTATLSIPWRSVLKTVRQQYTTLKKQQHDLSSISQRQERLRLKALRLSWRDATENAQTIQNLEIHQQQLADTFEQKRLQLQIKLKRLERNQALFQDSRGQLIPIAMIDIVRVIAPNDMSLPGKIWVSLKKLTTTLTHSPREANTEGGLAPAIFGTVLLVFLMSIFCIPLGVLTAIYLCEYAKEGFLLRLVRVAVYNLAGVPSIVFGIFGLGFFIYGVGGGLDHFFFPERLPTPTFGSGGILWASLTMALLTVPVVIVATEEGLSSIPKGMRQAAYALGSTRFQTLTRVVLPMSTPGILTGFVLAIARAAGETAPLMLTGVVKLAPQLPLDATFPYIHLERKFMSLAFHIFDLGFQSPNAEAAEPLVYFTSLLLIFIVIIISLTGIWLRNRMRRYYQGSAF